MGNVTLKGRENKIEICFSDQMDVLEAVKATEKLKESNKSFFEHGKMTVTYSGTEFTYSDEVLFSGEIRRIFGKNAVLDKKCILSDKEILHSLERDEVICRICRRTLRGGEKFESRGDAIIYGDVNPGATVVAHGNITVVGALRGNACIIGKGYVFANLMQPSQIRIGKVISYNKSAENVGAATAKSEKGEIILQCL